MHFTFFFILNNLHPVEGQDYVAATEDLVFPQGSTRVCHTIMIIDDNICESDKDFFSDLSPVSGMLPITIDPETARVIIDDSNEPECEYINCTIIT